MNTERPNDMTDLLAPAALSVHELNALARQLLEDNLFGLWVAGEVSNLTRAASGHYYFSLKDQHAQVRCAFFKHQAARLTKPLKEGDHIELTGKISIYEARGEYQINVAQVRHQGLGRLFEAYERRKASLMAEGLFDAKRKQNLPAYPQRIGIVTSLAAAALRDVLSTLQRRHNGLAVVVYPTPVQGAGSENHIATAIQTADARQEVDVLIVCRGGGSIEDLWAFNEEVVVRAMAACRLPIISGIGHETDFTLADFVADVRAPTPTGAAELVSPDKDQLWHRLQQHQQQWHNIMRRRHENASQKTDWLARRLRHPMHNLAQQRHSLSQTANQLQAIITRRLQQAQQQHHQASNNLYLLRPNIRQAQQQLHSHAHQLNAQWHQYHQSAQTRLTHAQHMLDAVSPEHILARGFSVVRDSQGKLIRHASAVQPNQRLSIHFVDGQRDVRVIESNQQDLFD